MTAASPDTAGLATGEPGPGPSFAPDGRPRWVVPALVALAVAAALASLAGTRWVYPHGSSNDDEAVYRFQAEMLADGRLTLPAEQAVHHRPWMSGVRDDRLVMVFPPTWAATLALAGATTGSHAAAVALSAALLGPAVALAVRRMRAGWPVAVGAAVAASASPFVLVHASTHLGYLLPVTLEAAAVAALLGAVPPPAAEAIAPPPARRRRVLLVVTGLLVGLLATTRPLDGALFSLCLALYLVVASGWRATLRAAPLVAAGVAVPLVALLGYNAAALGGPLDFPLQSAGGDNRFGFGPRHIADGTPVVDVTPRMAAGALRTNLAELPRWVSGGWAVLPLGVLGAWALARSDRRRAPSLAVLGGSLLVVFPAAYFFYWGNLLIVNGRKDLGPHYYLPLLLPLSVALAAGVAEVARRDRRWAAALVVALVVVGVVDLRGPAERAEVVTDRAAAEVAAVDAATAPPGAELVFLPGSADGSWILHPRGYFSNRPDLGGEVLFAADRGNANLDLVAANPDRRPLRFGLRAPSLDAVAAPVVEQLTVVRGTALTLHHDVVAGASGPVVVSAVAGGGGWRCELEVAAATGDRRSMAWTLDAAGLAAPTGCAGPASPAVPDPFGMLVLAVESGDVRVEHRFWWRSVDGGVELTTPAEPLVVLGWPDAPRPHPAEPGARASVRVER